MYKVKFGSVVLTVYLVYVVDVREVCKQKLYRELQPSTGDLQLAGVEGQTSGTLKICQCVHVCVALPVIVGVQSMVIAAL